MSFNYNVSGGYPPYHYDITGGALPPGVTLDASTGTLSGKPTQEGTFSWTMRVQDSIGQSASINDSSTIGAALPLFFNGEADDATQGTAYSYQYGIGGGVSPYAVTVVSGELPPGLTLSLQGLLSGTPTSSGDYTYTMRLQDSEGSTINHSDGMHVEPLAFTLSGDAPAATVGVAYDFAYTASNGVTPVTYAITAGALPGGITLNASTGHISGTPTTAGNFSWTITATDGISRTAHVDDTAVVNGIANYVKSLMHFESDFHDEAGNIDWTPETVSINTTTPLEGAGSGHFIAGTVHTNDKAAYAIGSTDPWCMEASIRFDAIPSGVVCIMARYYSSTSGISWQFRNEGNPRLRINMRGDSFTYEVNWSPNASQKYALKVNRDPSGNIRFFVDGTQVGATLSGSTEASNDVAPYLSIGALYYNLSASFIQLFTGDIDEWRYTVGSDMGTSNYTPSFPLPLA